MKPFIAGLVLSAFAQGVVADEIEGPPTPASAAELKMIRAALDDFLADADSAKFKGFRVRHTVPAGADHSATACGLVNAKNPFGAYTGYQKFYLMLSKGDDGIMRAIALGTPDGTAVTNCAEHAM